MSTKKRILKAALYVRVSTQWQIDKDSLPLQREELINYSKYALGIDKYEIFEDAGYSAKNTERPAYQQMLSRLRTGEFSHLCVWKIDRISRNLLDFASMYTEIKRLGITFVSKNEQFDTSTAIGEAMLKIILVFAELERNMTSERVTAVMLSRASNGHWNGGRVPYGYIYNKETGEFYIDEKEASVIRLIYDLYEANCSLLEVSRIINERGFRTRSNSAWSPATVSKMLKNPFYTGTYIYNRHDISGNGGNSSEQKLKDEKDWIVVENHHVKIVDKERQDKVINILSSKKYGGKQYLRKNVHIFAGILFCGYCGSQMQSTIDRPRKKNGYRPSIYACSSKRRFRDCVNKYISDIYLAPFVLNYLANIIKAQNNFGKSTSVETFEKKLLRGEVFNDVSGIEKAGLVDMYDMLKNGIDSNDVFTSSRVKLIEDNNTTTEMELLSAEKRKKERALERLKSLYLYDDTSMSETEYILNRNSLLKDINWIDSRMEKIETSSSTYFSMTDEDFLAKASYYIMALNLTEKRYVDFTSLYRKVEPQIIKEFINSVIQKIVIKSGKVESIRFKNGIEHKFLYNETKKEIAENLN